MKKNLLTMIIASIFATAPLSAQTICDSIRIDSTVVQSNYLWMYFFNQTQFTMAYPEIAVTLNPNPYMTVSSNLAVSTFLDVAGGSNNGVTLFLPTLTSCAAASTVPLNTLFSGTATLLNPNDSTFSCTFQFQFVYGTMTASGIANSTQKFNSLEMYPNPVVDEIHLNVIAPATEKVEIEVKNVVGEILYTETIVVEKEKANNISIPVSLLSQGIYFVSLHSNSCTESKMFVKQ